MGGGGRHLRRYVTHFHLSPSYTAVPHFMTVCMFYKRSNADTFFKIEGGWRAVKLGIIKKKQPVNAEIKTNHPVNHC